MKKILLILSAVAIISAGCNNKNTSAVVTPPSSAPTYNYTHQLKVGSQILNAEIANTTAAMEQGLSDRQSMDENQGMLFDFGNNLNEQTFWMKDMKFNLDFIWIADGKIVGVTPDVAHPNSPTDPLPTYSSPVPVNEVLEINSGWVKKNNISVGDVVNLLK